MKLEEKIMADRERQDFVRVRLREGIGSANITAGPFTLKLAAGETMEITRAEWIEIYDGRGVLELAQETKKTEFQKAAPAAQAEE